nr:ACP S-malonyltransferase [Melioribacteraceae bacterium]
LDEICIKASEKGIVQAANYNSPDQIVISGSVEGVKHAMDLCKSEGAKLVKELVVSGAFHSPLMSSAKERLVNQINDTPFFDSKIPVYANVTAKPVYSSDSIKDLLIQQLTKPVRWEETIKNMVTDGIEEFYEIGPGKVLQGLVKRISPNAKVFGIDKYSDFDKFL